MSETTWKCNSTKTFEIFIEENNIPGSIFKVHQVKVRDTFTGSIWIPSIEYYPRYNPSIQGFVNSEDATEAAEYLASRHF